MPVRHPGGARVVARPGEVQPPPPVRPDRTGHPDRYRQGPALLDVQLDERTDPAQALRIRAEQRRLDPAGLHRLGQVHPVPVGQRRRAYRIQRTGQQPGTQAGDAEPGALLLGEGDHPDRAPGPRAVLGEHIQGQERRDDAQRPVVPAAARYRVEVRPGHHRVARGRVAEPRPQVAVAVGLQVHPAVGRLLGEPLAAGEVRVRPREPVVPVGAAPDRFERAPQRPEPVRGHHNASRMGIRTPASRATRSAMS